MKLKLIISLLSFFLFTTELYAFYDSLRNKIEILKSYTESIEPIHIIGTDTFVIAKLPRPPDSINSFLKYCKDNNITEGYKYVFLPILKLNLAFGRFDYDFCNYYNDYLFVNNGIVDLAMHAMEIEYDPVDCLSTKTRDVYLWLRKHREIYRGYKPIKVYMRKVRKANRKNLREIKKIKFSSS